MRIRNYFMGLTALLLCVSANAVSKPAIHPRLFYTADRIAQVKEIIKSDAALKEAWDKRLDKANELLEAKLVSKEYAEGGEGQHGNYGRPSSQMHEMGSVLGLAWRMTKDKRYAAKLKEAMVHYGTFSRWAGDAHHDPPWHSELNTARFCYGFGVGYDSIRDYLTKEERKEIADSMVRLGILPTLDDWVLGGERIHALDSMGHNWWSVCVAMAGVASLSLVGDEPRAEYWVQKISDGFDEWFYYSGNVLQNKTTNFDRDGAFYESVSYANYALSEYLLFRLAYENTYGAGSAPEIPLLEKAGDFFVDTCYPTSEKLLAADFGDSKIEARGGWTLWLLGVNGFGKSEYGWYVEKTDPVSKTPLSLLYDGVDEAKIPKEMRLSKLYSDIGWATMRTSWDDDATMLAVKSSFAWNHAHPDAGSFILFHKGKPLIIDSGKCSYSRREYSGYYRTSRAHNVILTNGEAELLESCGHGDRGTAIEGKIHRLIDTAGIRYLFADATGPTGARFSRNYRHFVWIGDCILIFDDVRTHEEGKLEWLLHYEDKAEVRDGVIHLSNGDAKAVVQTVFPENMTIAEQIGLKDNKPDTRVTYLALSPEEETRSAKFITAVLPVDEDIVPPRLELLEDNSAVGVRVIEEDCTTDLWLNLQADGRKMHRNSCNTIAGWETDAYMFGVTYPKGADVNNPDSASRYFVACGSYLRKDDKLVVDSLSKLYTVFTNGQGEMEAAVQGQPLINAALRAKRKPQSAKINGKEAKIEYDSLRKSVRVRVNER